MAAVDPSKLGSWYAAYAPALVLYARQWAGPAAAEDVVHEAFVGLLSQRNEPAHPKAWLFRAVRNAAASHHRSSKRRGRREREAGGARPEWFCPRPEDLVDAAAAQNALAALPIEQREVVVMRIWGQMTLAEIADVTSSPLSSVYDRYKAALAAVRQKMESLCRKKTP